jgi:hypothetical protein
LEQVVLTPVLKNPAISRKGAKTEQIYIDAKIAKTPISRKAKKNQDGFSLRFFYTTGAGGS